MEHCQYLEVQLQGTTPHVEAPDFHIADYREETHTQHLNFFPSLLACEDYTTFISENKEQQRLI